MQGNRADDRTSLERDGVRELQGGHLRGETSQSILEDVWEEWECECGSRARGCGTDVKGMSARSA